MYFETGGNRLSSYNTFTDHELAELFKTGDKSAFTAIYQRYWKKIFVIAYKRLENSHIAEEIVQEIFLNFWRKRDLFTITTGLQNYFAIAVKFEILDLMRKKASANAYEKEISCSFSEIDNSTLRELDLLELQRRLHLTVSTLPEKCQLVFKLKHEQGYSQKQIAEELNISEKTVEAHLSKARKTLKQSFGKMFSLVAFLYL